MHTYIYVVHFFIAVHLSTYLYFALFSVCLSLVCLFIYLFIYLFVYLFVSVQLPPHPTVKALTRFHADDYIAFLRSTADGSSLSSSIHSGGGGGGPSSPIQEAPHGVFSPAAYNNAGYAANKQQQATAAQLHGLPVTAATASHSNSRSLSPSSVGGSTAASVDPTDTGGGPQGAPPFVDQISRFNIGEDCPVFDGLWEYCKTYTGGSIEGARRVVQGEYQFAINWFVLHLLLLLVLLLLLLLLLNLHLLLLLLLQYQSGVVAVDVLIGIKCKLYREQRHSMRYLFGVLLLLRYGRLQGWGTSPRKEA